MSTGYLSPASIPLPVSFPPTPALTGDRDLDILIDLFPNDAEVEDGGGNGLSASLDLDLDQLRSAIEDDDSLNHRTAQSSKIIEGENVSEGTETVEVLPPKEGHEHEGIEEDQAPPSSSVRADSLYEAMRSRTPRSMLPSPEREAGAEQEVLAGGEPQDDSSGELTKMMSRFPVIMPGPGSAYTHMRTQSHESFITNLRAQSGSVGTGTGSGGASGSGKASSSNLTRSARPLSRPKFHGRSATEPGTSEQMTREGEPEWMTNPNIPLFGPGSLSSAAAPQVHLPASNPPPRSSPTPPPLPPLPPPPPVPSPLLLPPPVNVCTPSSPRSTSLQLLQASLERNRLETEALTLQLKRAREDTAVMQTKFEELNQLVASMGWSDERDLDQPGPSNLPPSISARHAEFVGKKRRTNGVQSHQEEAREAVQREELEARKALRHVLQALSLPSSALSFLPPSSPPSPAPKGHPSAPTSLADVTRAMDFVRSIDALVWKTRRHGADSTKTRGSAALFGEENVKALTERVELWERIVRNKR